MLGGTLRFSVIIPVYNVEKYLPECLDSILEQDFSDYEVVIVDDGSNDGSRNVYSRYLEKSSVDIRVVRQENKGLLQARRAGIRASHGDYLWHVDGDDALAPHALSIVSDVIDKNDPDLVLIGSSDSARFDSMLPGFMPGSKTFFYKDAMNAVRSAFLSGAIPSMWAKIARRTCVDINRDYSEYGRLNLGEDQLQSLYLLDMARSVYCVREPLYFYRPNDSSITTNYRTEHAEQYGLFKKALYEQAIAWDEAFPGNNFTETALVGYLSNGFFDMRKSVVYSNHKTAFRDFRSQDLYPLASLYSSHLRFEQRVFCSLLAGHHDLLAYLCLAGCRLVTPLVRLMSK